MAKQKLQKATVIFTDRPGDRVNIEIKFSKGVDPAQPMSPAVQLAMASVKAIKDEFSKKEGFKVHE